MTLWEQYNSGRLLGSALADATGIALLASCAEKALFEALKRHLTRKELRCWVMGESGMTPETIAEQTGYTFEEVEKALLKSNKKIRQPKLQQEFHTLLSATEGEPE